MDKSGSKTIIVDELIEWVKNEVAAMSDIKNSPTAAHIISINGIKISPVVSNPLGPYDPSASLPQTIVGTWDDPFKPSVNTSPFGGRFGTLVDFAGIKGFKIKANLFPSDGKDFRPCGITIIYNKGQEEHFESDSQEHAVDKAARFVSKL